MRRRKRKRKRVKKSEKREANLPGVLTLVIHSFLHRNCNSQGKHELWIRHEQYGLNLQMRRAFLLALVLRGVCFAQNAIPPIGSWREHLPYHSVIDVAITPDRAYAATPYSLFYVDRSDRSTTRLSRIAGLSETGVSAIEYDVSNDVLLIAYTNSNLDIIKNGEVINIPDLKRDNIIGDKTVFNISAVDGLFFLSTGLGIVVVDPVKLEIKDSWFIGPGGTQLQVNGFTANQSNYFAATNSGLKTAPKNGVNHADASNWSTISFGTTREVTTVQDKVIFLRNDSLFVLSLAAIQFFYADGWPVNGINSSGNELIIAERKLTGESRIVILNSTAQVIQIVQQPPAISFPRKGVRSGNELWIADQFGGLSVFETNGYTQFKLNSPESVASGEMIVHDGIFYATAGAVNDNWNYTFNPNGVYRFKSGEWTNFNRFNFPVFDSVYDLITVAADQSDGSIWAGSFGGGLINISENEVEIYKQNSPLGQMIGDPGSYRVSGLAFDASNNLWISNYGAAQNFHVRKSDNTWKSFSIPFPISDRAVSQITIDDADQKWIVSPLGNGLIVFNHGSDIENEADDRWKILRTGVGSGNLPSNDVFTVTKDKSGFLWLGTSDGIGVIQCPQEIFSSIGCESIRPVIKEGAFAGFLFKGQEVRAIAVDGADRKWVGTKNGLWLVNADGSKVIEHFNETNSPLLSNEIRSIAIDGKTGEVYVATLNGIMSFRGSATEGGFTNNDVLVFPNPVPPNYNGSIAIRGLVNNAIVKITEQNGRLVYQSRALGGQAVWNGRDYQGRRVAGGIYLVLVSDDLKTEKVAAKIVIINN